jgi:DNA-binding beta-propeller fold protein YncE
MKKLFTALMACVFLGGVTAGAEGPSPLKLVTKYKMPASVHGRFDHFGVDLAGNRLFVTAEQTHAVLVFRLRDGRLVHTLEGITIPHAILYREDINRMYITDGGAGDLKIFDGKTYRLLGTVPLKLDADSIGYDPSTHDLYIDNGGGDVHEPFSMFSIVDTTAGKKAGEIKIDGETLEAMALERSRPRVYVNNPAKSQVEAVDRETRAVVASWPVTLGKRNVAMALDEPSHRLFVACRSGAIVVFDTESGKELQALPIAKGVDDLVFDPASRRLYAACGAEGGSVDVYAEEDPDHYKSLGQVPSGPGGRNAVLVPQLHRYFVSVPPQGDTPGEVYVYQVQ